MPNQHKIRRSKTLHERFDALLRDNPDLREDLQSIYYEAQMDGINGQSKGYPKTQHFSGRRAYRLGYNHGELLKILNSLGLTE